MLTDLTLSPTKWFASSRMLGALSLAFLVALLSGVSGCDSGPKGAKNSVSGKVTLNGEKVAGTVSFVGSDPAPKETPIKPDGTYQIDDPPTGQVKIVVKGMGGPTGAAGAAKPPPGGPEMPSMPGTGMGGATPPAKYGSPATTPLTYDVKPGKQTYNIELTP